MIAMGTKAKSESSEVDLLPLDWFSRTEEIAKALRPRIPAPRTNPLAVKKTVLPTAVPPTKPVKAALLPAEAAVSPILEPKKVAAAVLMAQATRASPRIILGFMLNK